MSIIMVLPSLTCGTMCTIHTFNVELMSMSFQSNGEFHREGFAASAATKRNDH